MTLVVKEAHQHLIYSTVAEIVIIIGVSWWQIYYLTSLMDRKLVV